MAKCLDGINGNLEVSRQSSGHWKGELTEGRGESGPEDMCKKHRRMEIDKDGHNIQTTDLHEVQVPKY